MKIFEKEMKEIARLMFGVELASTQNDPALDKKMQRVDRIVADFSRKYPGLALRVKQKVDHLRIQLYINEPSVKAAFEAASKIKGLQAIGVHGFDEATIQNADEFAA